MILTILSVILIGALCALSTKFIEYIIGDPWEEKVNTKAIFAFYGVWVAQGYDSMERKIATKMQSIQSMTKEKEERLLATKKNWFMALGACPRCFNIYVSILVCTIGFIQFDLSFWNLIYALPVSHWVLGKIL